MRKQIQIFIFLIFGLNLSAQKVIINSEVKIDSTELKITKPNFEYYAFSTFDNNKTDSLIVSIANVGLSITAIKIDLTGKPEVKLILFSDYGEYDGENSLDVELEYYELELNAKKFKKGDRIMGKIKGISKKITNYSGGYQIKFEGEFNHIIGKLMVKKNKGDNYKVIEK